MNAAAVKQKQTSRGTKQGKETPKSEYMKNKKERKVNLVEVQGLAFAEKIARGWGKMKNHIRCAKKKGKKN
jgi:hypothetical protein